jgi:hypothetical protein
MYPGTEGATNWYPPSFSPRTGQIVMAPVTFQVDGDQYVSVIAGNILVTFGLRKAQ